MAKKVNIRCSECDTIVQLEHGLWGWKKEKCPKCGNAIKMKDERMQVVECPHCKNEVVYDALKGDQNVCPVCQTPLQGKAEEQRFEFVPCPHCGVKAQIKIGQEKHTCAVCHQEFDVKEVLAHIHSVATEPFIIEGPVDPNLIIWQHPLNSFPFKSRLIVSEGTTALCLQDGECRYPVGPGSYPLEKSPLTTAQKLDAALEDSDVTFSTKVFFVRNSIPHSFLWGTMSPPRVLSADGETEVEVRASGSLTLNIAEPKAFVDLVGYRSQTVGDLTAQADLDDIHSKDAVLVELVRVTVNRAIAETLPKLALENRWNVMQLDRYKTEIEAAVRMAASDEFEYHGLRIGNFALRDFRVEEIADSAERRAKKLENEQRVAQLRRQIESWIQWTTIPAVIHMKDDPTLSAELTLGGTCKLNIIDTERLMDRSEVKQWITSDVSNEVIEKYFTNMLNSMLQNVVYDVVQPMIDDTGADIRELTRYYGYLRDTMSAYLNRTLGVYGLAVENFTMQQRELKKSTALEKMTRFASYKTETNIEEEVRRFNQKVELNQAVDASNQRINLKSIDTDEQREMGRLNVTDAQNADEIAETMTDLEIRAMDRAERLRRHREDQRIAAEDEAEQRRFSKEMRTLDQSAQLAERKDQIGYAANARSFDETLANQQRDSRLTEDKIKADIHMEEIKQRGELDAEQRAAAARRMAERDDADQKRLVGEILRKIEQSDFDWRQKLEEYDRLRRNLQVRDDAENLGVRTKSEVDASYSRRHLDNVLTKEEKELMEEIALRDEERAERVKRNELARQLEINKFGIAYEMEKLRFEAEQADKEAAAQERIHAQEIEIEKLQMMLAHYEEMGRQGVDTTRIQSAAETVRTRVENEYAAKHAQEIQEAEARSRREQAEREDVYADRAERLLKQAWEIQESLQKMQLINERVHDEGRARVDVAEAHGKSSTEKAYIERLNDQKFNELLQAIEKMTKTLTRVESKVSSKNSKKSAASVPNSQPAEPAPATVVIRTEQPSTPGYSGYAAQPGAAAPAYCSNCGAPISDRFASRCSTCGHLLR